MSVRGPAAGIAGFVAELARAPPPLARIDAIERTPSEIPPDGSDFRIMPNRGAETRTGVAPDAATCPACRDEIFDPATRRYRYPFTNCTHCGPRLSIIQAIPYDRSNTTMSAFRMCDACAAEYVCPADRRFHAQPIACPECGPRVWLQPECAGDAIEAARVHPAVRAYRGDQGTGRRTPRLRRHQCQRRRTPARGETARCKTVRPHGQRSRRDHALCRGNVGGDLPPWAAPLRRSLC